MRLTSGAMAWLNQNRRRSYPMVRDDWRKVVSATSGLDCVVLDALVFDGDVNGSEELRVKHISVSADSTIVSMSYGGRNFNVVLEGGSDSGEGSFCNKVGVIPGNGTVAPSVSFSFSSHAYIHGILGEGEWDVDCPVLRSRVLGLSGGMGVDGIRSGGSYGVPEHDAETVATGDVVLEDGYRTSPIIYRGGVLVRVGKRYGLDPCHYGSDESMDADCRSPLFFFCGQNAVNSGNIVLKGGQGVGVAQGGTYKVRSGTCKGKNVPCIEIIAGKELIDLYGP